MSAIAVPPEASSGGDASSTAGAGAGAGAGAAPGDLSASDALQAIVVPGGGQTDSCSLPPYVQARFDRALELYSQSFWRLHTHTPQDVTRNQGHSERTDSPKAIRGAPVILALSAGTTHKPSPRDSRGFNSKESTVGVTYVLQCAGLLPAGLPPPEGSSVAGDVGTAPSGTACLAGATIDPDLIWEEGYSLDTLGNAYFARLMHTDPAGLRRLVVVTNKFHMPRTKAIFEFVFGLPRCPGAPYNAAAAKGEEEYSLTFEEVPDVGLSGEVLAGREAREASSLAGFLEQAKEVHTMQELHQWINARHMAYAPRRLIKRETEAKSIVDPAVLSTY